MDLSKELVVVTLPSPNQSYTSFNSKDAHDLEILDKIRKYKNVATNLHGSGVIGNTDVRYTKLSNTLVNKLIKYSGEVDEDGVTMINGSSLFDFSGHLVDGKYDSNKEFEIITFSNPVFDSKKEAYNTLGLVKRGNQFTAFEVGIKNGVVHSLRKPMVAFNQFDSKDVVFQNVNGVNKITQKVNSFNEDGYKTMMNHEYYSIMKNMFIASKKRMDNDYSGYLSSIDALKTSATLNVRNISSRSTENIVTSMQGVDMFGIGNKANYNDLTAQMQFSKKMIDPYLEQVELNFSIKADTEEEMRKSLLKQIDQLFDDSRLKNKNLKSVMVEDQAVRERIASQYIYDYMHPNGKERKLEDGKKVKINKTLKEFVDFYAEMASEYNSDTDPNTGKKISNVDPNNLRFSITSKEGNINTVRVKLNDREYIDLKLKDQFRKAQINSQMVKEKAAYQINKTRYYFQIDDKFETEKGIEYAKKLMNNSAGDYGIIETLNEASKRYNSIEKSMNNIIEEKKRISSIGDSIEKKLKTTEDKTKIEALENRLAKWNKKYNEVIDKEKQLYIEAFGSVSDEESTEIDGRSIIKFNEIKNKAFNELSNIAHEEYNLKILQAEGFQSLKEYENYKENIMTKYDNYMNDPRVSDIDKKVQAVKHEVSKSKIKFIDSALSKFDKEHLSEFLNSGNQINKYVDVSLQSNNTRGIITQLLLSSMDILGSKNVFGQRHGQAASKMSSAVLKTASGETLDVAQLTAKWSPVDKYNQFRVLNKNAETILEGFDNMTGHKIVMPSLFKNISTSIYTETDFSFQDSELTSTLMGMRNLSMYDDKTLTVSYDALDLSLFEDFKIGDKQYDAQQIYEYLRQPGKFDINNLTNQDSFEYKFLNQLLDKDAFTAFQNNLNNDMIYEFNEIGSGIGNIKSLNTIDERNAYIKETEEALQKYNTFLNKYFIKSNDKGKGVTLLNKNAVGKGQALSISGSNYGFIEGLEFTEEGIKIKTKGLTVQSLGSKIMNDGVKGTVGNQAHLFGINYNGHFYRGDVIVNEKMTKGKRGFNGTFYGRSLLTMSMHALSSERLNEDPNNIDYGARFDNFLKVMKEKTKKDYGSGISMDIFELLGVDISYDRTSGSLSIGETAMIGDNKKRFLSLMGDFGDLQSAQQYLVEVTNKKIDQLMNHAINDSEAEIIGHQIFSTLYGAYDEYLKTLNGQSQRAARIFIPSKGATLEKSFITQGENGLKYGMQTVQNIGEQGAFVLLSFTHGMSEAKAREIDEAVKLTRLSNIVLTESGYSWLSEELNTAMSVKNTDSVIEELIMNKNFFKELQPGTSSYNNFFDNIVDFSKDQYEDVKSNESMTKFLQKSVLGKFIDFDEEKGRLNKPLRGMLKNFDEKFISDSKQVVESIKGKDLVGSLISFSFEKLMQDLEEKSLATRSVLADASNKIDNKEDAVNFLRNKASNLLNDHDFVRSISDELNDIEEDNIEDIYYRIQKKLQNVFHPQLDDDQITKNITRITKNKDKYYDAVENMIKFSKTLRYGTMNLSVPFNDDVLKSLEYNFSGADLYLVKDILKGNNMSLLKNIVNDFSGGDIYNLSLLDNIIKNNSMPFLVKTISIDQIGDIVPNKSLDRVNKIIGMQKQLSNLSKLEGLKIGGIIPTDIKNLSKDELKKVEKAKRIVSKYYNNENYMEELFPHLDIETKKKIQNKLLSKSVLDNSLNELDELNDIISGKGDFKNKNLSLLLGIEGNGIKGFGDEALKELLDNILNNGQNRNVYISTLTNLIEKIEATQSSIQGMTDMQSNYKILESVKGRLLNLEKKVIKNRLSKIKNPNDLVFMHNLITENVFNKIDSKREEVSQKIFRAMFGFKQEGTPFDDFASMRIDKSAAISPREGSAITNFIRNEAQEIIELQKNGKIGIVELNQKKYEFYRAIGLLYGDFHAQDVKKMLQVEDVNAIKDKFDRLSGVVVGDEEQWRKVHFDRFFTRFDRKNNKSVKNNITYIDLLRNPHQYIGSIKPVRAVMIDETNRNLSFLKYMFGNQSKIEGGQNNLLFLGKRTAISANGDFDGDVFQIMRYTDKDFAHLDKSERKRIINRLNQSRKLYYILNDHANEDLEAIFTDPDFSKKHLGFFKNKKGKIIKTGSRDQFGEMYYLIKSLGQYEGFDADNLTPEQAYKIIQDRHHILKFEYLRTLDAMQDESKQHANLPSIAKKLNAEVDKITNGKIRGDFTLSRDQFENFFLSLDENEKKKLFLSTINEDDLEVIDQFFDGKNMSNEVKKKLQIFKSLDSSIKRSIFYDYFSELLDDTKGIMKFNGLKLADTAYEAYTGISRTGIIHSALTSVREAATFVRQDNEFNAWIDDVAEVISKQSGVEIDTKNLKRMTSFANTFGSFNTLGTVIEKLSISSKLGGKVDPYISANNIAAFGRKLATTERINAYINFNEIERFVSHLRENMDSDSITYAKTNKKAKEIKTIKDITDIFFFPILQDDDSETKQITLDLKRSMNNVLGALLGIDISDQKNFMNVEIDDKSAHNILANVANVGSMIVKGVLESETGNFNVVNGTYNKISKGSNIAASLNHFLNETIGRGINQRSFIGKKFISNIKKWVFKTTDEETAIKPKYKPFDSSDANISMNKLGRRYRNKKNLDRINSTNVIVDTAIESSKTNLANNAQETLENVKNIKNEVTQDIKDIETIVDEIIEKGKTEAETIISDTKVDDIIDEAQDTLDNIEEQKIAVENPTNKTTIKKASKKNGKKLKKDTQQVVQQTLFDVPKNKVKKSNRDVDKAIKKEKISKPKNTKTEGVMNGNIFDLNQNVYDDNISKEVAIDSIKQTIKSTDPIKEDMVIDKKDPILTAVNPNRQKAHVPNRRGRPTKEAAAKRAAAQARIEQMKNETIKDTSDAEIEELNRQEIKEEKVKTDAEIKKEKVNKTFENISKETNNTSDDIINELKTERNHLKNQIDDLNVEIEELKKNLEKRTEQLNRMSDKKYTTEQKDEIVKKHLEEYKEKIRAKFEERQKKIEELEQQIANTAEEINVNNQTIDNLNKELSEAKSTAKDLANKLKNAELDNGDVNIKHSSVKNAAKEVQEALTKYKNIAFIGAGVGALVLFFRIFQSNRSVVELDINEEQYEKSQGSLYRSLGNYNINTNIRSFY